MIPSNLVLETNKVFLRPLMEEDSDVLFNLAQDEDMWKYFALNLADKSQFKKWLDSTLQDKSVGARIPFTITDKTTNKIPGSMSFLNISYHDLRLEIGSSWLGKDFRGTDVNRHSKFSMMRYAFEELNFERVEFKTDVLNERARNGLRKIGGIEEGVLRSHMTMWNDRRRSSVYYSVLKNEWPQLKQTIFKDIE